MKYILSIQTVIVLCCIWSVNANLSRFDDHTKSITSEKSFNNESEKTLSCSIGKPLFQDHDGFLFTNINYPFSQQNKQLTLPEKLIESDQTNFSATSPYNSFSPRSEHTTITSQTFNQSNKKRSISNDRGYNSTQKNNQFEKSFHDDDEVALEKSKNTVDGSSTFLPLPQPGYNSPGALQFGKSGDGSSTSVTTPPAKNNDPWNLQHSACGNSKFTPPHQFRSNNPCDLHHDGLNFGSSKFITDQSFECYNPCDSQLSGYGYGYGSSLTSTILTPPGKNSKNPEAPQSPGAPRFDGSGGSSTSSSSIPSSLPPPPPSGEKKNQ
jgi:hypothetical protein